MTPARLWSRVSFASDVDPETDACSLCGVDYAECPCPGPTMDDYEYRLTDDGVLEARTLMADCWVMPEIEL